MPILLFLIVEIGLNYALLQLMDWGWYLFSFFIFGAVGWNLIFQPMPSRKIPGILLFLPFVTTRFLGLFFLLPFTQKLFMYFVTTRLSQWIMKKAAHGQTQNGSGSGFKFFYSANGINPEDLFKHANNSEFSQKFYGQSHLNESPMTDIAGKERDVTPSQQKLSHHSTD